MLLFYVFGWRIAGVIPVLGFCRGREGRGGGGREGERKGARREDGRIQGRREGTEKEEEGRGGRMNGGRGEGRQEVELRGYTYIEGAIQRRSIHQQGKESSPIKCHGSDPVPPPVPVLYLPCLFYTCHYYAGPCAKFRGSPVRNRNGAGLRTGRGRKPSGGGVGGRVFSGRRREQSRREHPRGKRGWIHRGRFRRLVWDCEGDSSAGVFGVLLFGFFWG